MKHRLRLFALVVLGVLLLGLLVPFSSLPVEGFPHLVTDSFDVDSIDDTLWWDETEVSGSATAGGGYLNLTSTITVTDTVVYWNDMSNDSWVDYLGNGVDSSDGDLYTLTTTRDGTAQADEYDFDFDTEDYPYFNMSITDVSDDWYIGFYFVNNTAKTVLGDGTTGLKSFNMEELMGGLDVSKVRFGVYTDTETNYVIWDYAMAFTNTTSTGVDVERRLDAEDEVFEYSMIFSFISGDGLFAATFGSVVGDVMLSFYLVPNGTDHSFVVDSPAGVISYYNNCWTMSEIYTLFVVIDKTGELQVSLINTSETVYQLTNRSVDMPTSYEVVDVSLAVEDEGMVYVYSISTYFDREPLPRAYVNTDQTFNVFTYEEILFDEDGAGSGTAISGHSVYYPDLQNLAFRWKRDAANYESTNAYARISAYFVYTDGTRDILFYATLHYQEVAIPSRLCWSPSGYSAVYHDMAVRNDYFFSIHMEGNKSYRLQIYNTTQGDEAYFDLSVVDDRYDVLAYPDEDKVLIGVRMYHDYASANGITVDAMSKLDGYTVQYGDDAVVPEIEPPIDVDIDGTPELPTDLLGLLVYPLIMFMFTIASAIFDVIWNVGTAIGTVVGGVLAGVGNFLTSTVNVVMEQSLVLVWGFIDTVGTMLGIEGLSGTVIDIISPFTLMVENSGNIISFTVDGLNFGFETLTVVVGQMAYFLPWVWIAGIGYVGLSLFQWSQGDDQALYNMFRNVGKVGIVFVDVIKWIVGLMVSFVQMIVNMIRG